MQVAIITEAIKREKIKCICFLEIRGLEEIISGRARRGSLVRRSLKA
jgi:hypothetical protein